MKEDIIENYIALKQMEVQLIIIQKLNEKSFSFLYQEDEIFAEKIKEKEFCCQYF